MAYHNIPSTKRSKTNAKGQVAPPGYHYMPDGKLMSDAEHAQPTGPPEGSFDTIPEFHTPEVTVNTIPEPTILPPGTSQMMLPCRSPITGTLWPLARNVEAFEVTPGSATLGQAPGFALGYIASGGVGWHPTISPHMNCVQWHPAAFHKTPMVGQCFGIQNKMFRITKVNPGALIQVNGGISGPYSVTPQAGSAGGCKISSTQATSATVPAGNFNPMLPSFYSGLRAPCTNLPCGQECDQSLTMFSPIQSLQYGCNYQALPGPILGPQPCLQTNSCGSQYTWSFIYCKCVPITPTPQAKIHSGQGATIRIINDNFSSAVTEAKTKNLISTDIPSSEIVEQLVIASVELTKYHDEIELEPDPIGDKEKWWKFKKKGPKPPDWLDCHKCGGGPYGVGICILGGCFWGKGWTWNP